MYCQIPFGVLQCFYCYFDFSKQHFTKDNNEKKKPLPQLQNNPLPSSKELLKISTQTRTPNFNQPASQVSILGSREKSGESSTRKETRVRGAGWEARSLATSFAFQQAKLQQLSFALLILMTISFDCETLTLFAVYKLYWLLIPYFHLHSDLERSEIASNRILKQIRNSGK